jgi:class 3 adenylate cyclase
MAAVVEERISGTRKSAIILEFLKNSFHFPLANILLEMVLEGPAHYIASLDFYSSLLAPAVQAYFLGSWTYEGKPRPLLGNLIGPLLYSIVDVAVAADEFFVMPFHYAYWGFALGIGIVQELRLRAGERWQSAFILVENILRSSILAVMYWFMEKLTEPKYADPSVFFGNRSHIFILSAIFFLGLVVGLDDARSQRFLGILRDTASRLQTFSNWLLGRNMLSMALTDPEALSLVRRERTVMFLDIRGFTSWSERQEPEVVVGMLNDFYDLSESVFANSGVILIKYTADEVMAFFAEAEDGLRSAHQMHLACMARLADYGLAVGTGLHAGFVVEGLLGSSEVKRYEIIGDTVNTAKRICSAADGGEFLVSGAVLAKAGSYCKVLNSREVNAKGKSAPLLVHSVRLIDEAAV